MITVENEYIAYVIILLAPVLLVLFNAIYMFNHSLKARITLKKRYPKRAAMLKAAAKERRDYKKSTQKQSFKTNAQVAAKRKIKIMLAIALGVTVVVTVALRPLMSLMYEADPSGATINGVPISSFPGASSYYWWLALSYSLILLGFFLLFSIIFVMVQKSSMAEQKRKATFRSSEGIMYYREFLKGITPVEMSVLMDLQIEKRKDIAATLLRLYDKKVIDFEGQGVVFLNHNADLDNGERELLEMIGAGGITPDGAAKWKKKRFEETLAKGYIEERDYNDPYRESSLSGPFRFISGCLPGCFTMSFIICVITYLTANMAWKSSDLNGDFESVELAVNAAAGQCIVMICIYLFVMVAVFSFFNLVNAAAAGVDKYERTIKGDMLAEKIAGLKNFISDFSNLSQAEKEQIVLWNDFLVYAVVLEENEQIVNDIGRQFKKEKAVGIIRRY